MFEEILVIDETLSRSASIRTALESEGFSVYASPDHDRSLELMDYYCPRLVIVSVDYQIDTLKLLRSIDRWAETPVITISSFGNIDIKLECFECGANDYVGAPFHIDELVARVKVALRYASNRDQHKRLFLDGDLKIDFDERKVIIHNNEIGLTPIEHSLLYELVNNEGKILEHGYLLGKVWGKEYIAEKVYLHVYVSHLRNKINTNENHQYIRNIPKVGYLFKKRMNDCGPKRLEL